MADHTDADNALSILSAAFARSKDAVIIFDAAERVLFSNLATSDFFRLDPHLIAAAQPDTLVPSRILQANPDAPPFEHSFDCSGVHVTGSVSLAHIPTGKQNLCVVTIRCLGKELIHRREMRLLSLASNESDRAVIITDASGHIIYVNSTFTKMFGMTAEAVLGKRAAGLLSEDGEDVEVSKRLHEKIARRETFQEEMPARDKQGQQIWLSSSITPSFDDAGGLQYLTIALSNITESKQLQVLQRDVLEAVAQDIPIEEVMTLLCQRVEAMAPDIVCSILSVDAQSRLHPLAAPSLPAYFGEAIDGLPAGPLAGSCGTAAYFGEPVMVEDIETDPRWELYKSLPLPLGLLACWSSPIKLRDGRVAGTFAFYFHQKRGPSPWHEHIVNACVHLCVVAIERHEAKAHIAKLAYYDTLTGLPNRTMLRDQISLTISASPEEPKQLAFLFLDIDRFKDVNDTLGHSVGDALLVEIARRLQKQLRGDDIVSRHGGDEFVAVLADCDGPKASMIAKRLQEALSEPVVIEGTTLPVSASIGISLYPEDGTDEDTLLKNADAAMYEAKNAGRGTFRFFSAQMNDLAQERLVLGAALRDSIARGLMRLAYQPQIRTGDGALHGVEALARWNDPLSGEIAPSRFIALAEECGLIEAIGDWAMNEACRQMADWHRRGIDVPSVSVNLSPIHFRNRDLFRTVVQTLDRHGLHPHMLTLEITEGIMMDEGSVVIENANALRAHGVHLSMDDFGTGYSSLSCLARLPVSELKIDRGFMAELEIDRNAQALVTAVVRIGQSLGLTVVAEGVETQAQLDYLQALQCQVVQGFLYSRALPPAEFETWLDGYTSATTQQRGAA